MMDDVDELKVKEKRRNPYSMKYRIFKTILMIYAWISFGITLELIGVALEDLRILLNVEYQYITAALMLRSISYMIVTLFVGVVIDKLSRYSEFLMGLAQLLMVIPNFLIPWIRTYSLSMALFFLQGVGHALYDVCGNQIIFKLWSGISESPVNAMHAGYGIGAMITVQLLKPFLKYDPNAVEKSSSNMTSNSSLAVNNMNKTHHANITADDITLQIPYSISGSVGVLTIIIFIIAQLVEFRQIKKFNETSTDAGLPLKEKKKKEKRTENKRKQTISERVFGRQLENTKHAVLMTLALVLFFFLFMSVQWYNFVLTSFIYTYGTKGPAKFLRDEFLTIQTFFWILFIIGRFSAALVGFKLNSLYFFSALVYLNGFIVFLFNTKLNVIKSSYWFIVLALGFTNGPLIPCCFAAAKYVFVKTNAFLLSVFCIGLGIGGLGAFQSTGLILDNFKPSKTWLGYKDADSSYVIPMMMFVVCIFSAICVIVALALHLIYKEVFHGKKEKSGKYATETAIEYE